MTTKSGIIIVVIVAIVVAGIFIYYASLPTKPPIGLPGKPEVIVPPPATGNVDDLVNAMLKEISDEDTVLKTGEGDTTLITIDSQEIGNLGQSIDEKEL